jgi:ethanolaminephosphotransferase
MESFFKGDMLNTEQKDELRRYKYRGGDLSITYKYVLSPMAEWIVNNCVPTWMAPNLITLIGLFFNILSTIMTLIYDPTLTSAPWWLPPLTGICMFTYQTFDNMDGKQARKIGASSPLGLLFDHGCDAITAGLTVIPLASVFGVGWSATGMFTLWFSTFFTFFVQTWEEYYLHEMWLPIVNGASEGLVMISSACIATGYVGTQWWQTPSINLHQSLVPMFPFQFLIFNVLCISGPAILTQIVKTLKYLYYTNEINNIQKKEIFLQTILGLIMLITFVGSSFIWCFISENALKKTNIQLVIFMMFTFFELATHLMLMHTTNSKVNQGTGRFLAWSTLLLPLNSFYGNYYNVYLKLSSYMNYNTFINYFTVSNTSSISGTNINFILKPIINEILLMNILMIISVIYVIIKGYYTLSSVADTLDLDLLTVKTTPPYYINWAPKRRWMTHRRVYGYWIPIANKNAKNDDDDDKQVPLRRSSRSSSKGRKSRK